MTSYITSVCQQRDQPSSQMAEGDSTALFHQRFLQKFRQRPENMWSQQSIYRIPSLLRDLHPDAYEPRVVSIGPYHHGKEHLQAMEEHKHRALNRFKNINGGISLDDILAEFKRETNFSVKVRNCYTEPLERQWQDDNVFFHLMVLDGCFVLELLHGNYSVPDPTKTTDRPDEKHALLSYVKMDMLMLDNQIPLLVLRKLASIAKLPTGSENVAIQVEEPVEEQVEEQVKKELNIYITGLIWKFYGTMNDEIPADDAHHVLDAYWKGCIGIGDYDGWASRESADELGYLGVLFRPSSGGGVADGLVARGSFRDVAFVDTNVYGRLYLPRLTIDETTRPTLLNLMAFERLHLQYHEKTHQVTNYVLLMGSLIRSEKDVEYLRRTSILLCSPGWTDESVVKLFADLTRNVVFNGTRRMNPKIDAFCKRPLNRIRSVCNRELDLKTLIITLLTLYGVMITVMSNTYTNWKNDHERKNHL